MLNSKGNRAAHCKACHYEQVKRYRKTPAGKEARQKENLTRDDWLAVLERFGKRWYYCGVAGAMTRDHIEPFQRGGAHDPENLLPACKPCNSAKGPRFLLEWVVASPERFISLGA